MAARWSLVLVPAAAIAVACGAGSGGSNGTLYGSTPDGGGTGGGSVATGGSTGSGVAGGSSSASPGAGGTGGGSSTSFVDAGGTGGTGASGGSAGSSTGSAGSSGPGGSDAGGSGAGGSAAAGSDAGESKGAAGAEAGVDGSAGLGSAGDSGGAGQASAGVHAVGNQLYDGSKAIRLLGVDESGTQYECSDGDGVFDPTDNTGANSATSITAMLSWGVNAVRIPLNEDCWLGLNGVEAAYAGASYQSAIETYVTTLLSNNIYPILDLHFTEGPGGTLATDQQPMPDAAHGADFWTSVATAFKAQDRVIFDLFNEPFPDSNTDATGAWQCWGATTTSSCPGVAYPVVGMQGMLNAVRTAGATNFVMLGGIEYANDLSQWLTYEPTDPANNVGASWHVYTNSNYTSNHTLAADATPVLAKVPIVAGEIGDTDTPAACNGTFITTVMDFLDNPGTGIPPQSYLAWSWSTDNSPKLLSSYDPVTPTCDGPYYKTHILAQK
jgi:endoglucanase